MSVKKFNLFFLLSLAFLVGGNSVPPSQTNYGSYSAPQSSLEDINTTLRQLKIGFSTLKNAVSNHENEIRVLENKLENELTSFEHIRNQLNEDMKAQQALIKNGMLNTENSFSEFELKINQLETLTKSTVTDLRSISNQANEFVAALTLQNKKIQGIEESIESQNQRLKQIEEALKAMMELIQIKESPIPNVSSTQNGKTYKVQAGDSLEKIARLNQVSVKDLRESNPNVVNDKIFQGQILNLP